MEGRGDVPGEWDHNMERIWDFGKFHFCTKARPNYEELLSALISW